MLRHERHTAGRPAEPARTRRSFSDSEALVRLDDDELALRSAAGCRAAFAELYRRYREDLCEHAATLLGSAEGSEDAMQDSYLALLERLLDGSALDVPVLPALLDELRAAVAVAQADQEYRSWPDRPVPAPAREFSVPVHDLVKAADAFRCLPRPAKSLVWVIAVERWSASAVADLLGVDPVTVGVMMAHSVESLRLNYLQEFAPLSVPVECRAARGRLAAWICGRLPREPREQVSRHVANCAGCGEIAFDLRALRGLMPDASFPWPLCPSLVRGSLGDPVLSRQRRGFMYRPAAQGAAATSGAAREHRRMRQWQGSPRSR